MEEKTQEKIHEIESAESQPIETNAEGPVDKTANAKLVKILVAIALILIAAGVIYNSPRNKLKRALASENLIEAEHIYSDNHLSEDWRARDVLFAFIDKEIEKFDLGEKDYDSVFQTLSNINSNFEYMDIGNKLSTLADMKTSKENFALAERAEQANDLATAIIYYDSVGYSLYDKANSKVIGLKETYKAEIIEKAKALAEKKNYRAAAELLDYSLEALTADSEIISLRDDNQAKADDAEVAKTLSDAKASANKKDYVEAIDILESCFITDSRITEKIAEYQNLAIAALLEEAENSVKDGDYSSAIFTLETCSLESEEIEERLAEITKAYEEKVLADAEALAKEGRYEDAVSTINLAIATLGEEKSSFTQKIEEYKAKYPVSLLNLSPSSGDDYSTISSHYDIYGNVSEKSLYFAMSNDSVLSKSKQVKYAVSGKYKAFSGRILVDAYYSVGTAKCSIAIYADDVLKYSNDSLTKESEPIDIDIDIENAKSLKIVVEYISGGGDYKIDYGPTLYKTNVSLIIDSPVFHN